MTTTGPNFPSTIINVTRFGQQDWTSPSNAAASDNAYATATANTNYLKTSAHGFAIPAGDTIFGVQVDVEGKATVINRGSDASVKIEATGSSDLAAGGIWGTSDSTHTFGGPTELWGATLTPAIINAGGFGAYYAATVSSTTVSIDAISITVYHGLPTALKVVTSTLSLSDGRVRRSISKRVKTETLGIVLTRARRGQIARVISNTLGLTEAKRAGIYGTLKVIANDTLGFVDSAALGRVRGVFAMLLRSASRSFRARTSSQPGGEEH